MKKALFAYFGRFFDHSLDIPGHPLYSLFLLKSLAKTYGVDQFDIFYYDKYQDKPRGEFTVLKDQREKIFNDLIRKDDVSMHEAMTSDYDLVFLKYRFPNYSRLKQGSLDHVKFTELAKSRVKNLVVIDTDAEVREPWPQIVSLFAGDYTYPSWTERVQKVIPVLRDDVLEAIDRQDKFPIQYDVTFIGNEKGKDELPGILSELSHRSRTTIVVQGKWESHPFIWKHFNRVERYSGYHALRSSICTLQLSKDVYKKFDFMSPRIFESYLLGTIVFGKNSFMSNFGRFEGVVELREKIEFLRSLDGSQYKKVLLDEVEAVYNNLEEKLCSASRN